MVEQIRRLGPETAAAVHAARTAGALVRASFGGPGGGSRTAGRARRNGPHDVVSRLDAASERLIARILLDATPGAGFIGEETRPRAASVAGPDAPTWIVDPIDGTVGFVAGIPFFSVSIALAIGSRLVLGVVHDPSHDETFVARAGEGAWLLGTGEAADGRRLHVRRLASGTDAVVGLDPGDPDDTEAVERVDAVRRQVRVGRTLGSTALSLAYLAAGRLDGVLQVRGLQAVDIAAGGLLAREAGARVTDAAGGPWLDLRDLAHGRGVAAAGPTVHRCLVGRGCWSATQAGGASPK